MSKQFVCSACGYLGKPKPIARGNIGIELILWLCFLLPGLMYSAWRSSGAKGCPKCKTPNMIPAESPIGRKLCEQYHAVEEPQRTGTRQALTAPKPPTALSVA